MVLSVGFVISAIVLARSSGDAGEKMRRVKAALLFIKVSAINCKNRKSRMNIYAMMCKKP